MPVTKWDIPDGEIKNHKMILYMLCNTHHIVSTTE